MGQHVPLRRMGRERGAAVGMVLAAAASLQVGAAFAVGLFDDVGPGGAVFLRLALAAACCARCGGPRSRAGGSCGWWSRSASRSAS